ncbi:hypothetical protein ACFQ5F_04055 [Kroppenstedtia eburnea]
MGVINPWGILISVGIVAFVVAFLVFSVRNWKAYFAKKRSQS